MGDAGVLIDGGRSVLLKPDDWVGKRLPLLPHINVNKHVERGDWIVLLYHFECPVCQLAIAEFDRAGRRPHEREAIPKLALVEIPPYAADLDSVVPADSPCVRGRLAEITKWFVKTPLEVRISDGVVLSTTYEIELPGTPEAFSPSPPTDNLSVGSNANQEPECGPACLYLACRIARNPHSIAEVQCCVDGHPGGTSMLALKRAGEKLGFLVKAVAGRWDSLQRQLARQTAVSILHVNANHFVVAVGRPGAA